MYVDDLPFIRYNDFHAPLTSQDIGVLEYARTKSGKLKRRFAGGTGMADVLDPATLEQLVAGGQSVETDAEAK
ncbi:hypothetical protein ACNQ2Q_26405, partial [Enterobacter cloacae complex sp.6701430]